MRERLIELIKGARKKSDEIFAEETKKWLQKGEIPKHKQTRDEIEADYLLENGVVLLPCKVGQTVYVVDKRLNVWWQGEVDCVYCNKNSFEYGILFDNDEYGAYNEEDVFFTKEEAEAKLKGGAEE